MWAALKSLGREGVAAQVRGLAAAASEIAAGLAGLDGGVGGVRRVTVVTSAWHLRAPYFFAAVLILSFLLLIGFTLTAEGLGQHISKGYIYFAMGFSVFVEVLNLRARARSKPIHLREPYVEEPVVPTPAGARRGDGAMG